MYPLLIERHSTVSSWVRLFGGTLRLCKRLQDLQWSKASVSSAHSFP